MDDKFLEFRLAGERMTQELAKVVQAQNERDLISGIRADQILTAFANKLAELSALAITHIKQDERKAHERN